MHHAIIILWLVTGVREELTAEPEACRAAAHEIRELAAAGRHGEAEIGDTRVKIEHAVCFYLPSVIGLCEEDEA